MTPLEDLINAMGEPDDHCCPDCSSPAFVRLATDGTAIIAMLHDHTCPRRDERHVRAESWLLTLPRVYTAGDTPP